MRNWLVAFALAMSACTLPVDDASELGEQGLELDLVAEPDYDPDPCPPERIDCDVHVDDPHISKKNPENVNVHARVVCKSTVTEIKMRVTLQRDGTPVKSEDFKNKGKAILKGHAAAKCVDGTYQGVATATIVLPSGNTPNPITRSVTGASRSITCEQVASQ